MRKSKRLLSLFAIVISALILASCSKTAENEHLPEYCRTYTGFMEFASADIYELLGGINSTEYLSTISKNELIFVVYEDNREIDLDGIQCFQNLTSLTLEGPAFKDISPISALKNIQQITLESTNVVNISSFRNLSKVNNLTIANTKTLQSVEGVEEMTKLTYLNLSDNGIVNVDELNQLINLDTLILSNNEISFFPSINQLEKLETLDVSNNTISRLGEDLSGLRNLKNLDMSENELCDISTLDDLVNLETLDLSFNDLGCNPTSPDFSSLEGATKLRSLKLNDNNLSSISDLTGRNLPLETLLLENNMLDDISPISGFTQLKQLTIFNNNISDISELSDMDNITQIDLSENNISDFSNLRSIDDLEIIDLSDNVITFIPDISDSWPSLTTLNLESNLIDDMSGVKGHQNLKRLVINNNGLFNIKGLSDLPALDEFILYQEVIVDPIEPQLPETNPNIITKIEDSFNTVPLLYIEDDGTLDLDYTFGPGLEILGSFTNDDRVEIVNLSSMDIDVIDSESFVLENLEAIYVQDNNITDISFILGNPEIRQIDISSNPVNNLTILTGSNTDLGNLEQIRARDITGANDLTSAFIGLPDLNFVDLTDTNIVTISDSFNDLDELTTLLIVGDNLTSIDSSFNNIYATHNSTNIINLKDGNLYSIVDSFNNGIYEQIVIQDHTTLEVDTIISGSFNNLDVRFTDSIVVSGNDFALIEDSFNTLLCDNLALINNSTETITTSLDQVDINFELNLQNNELSTLDLSGLLNVTNIDLSHNALTTVDFLDAIVGLETLDISSQFTADGLTPTLTVIDGINNMVSLDDLTMDGIPVTSIDGFKNVGITSFALDFTANNDIFITSITADSFENSLITDLDIAGHNFSNIDFMDNFPILTTLDISVDMADLSGFTGSSYETTLTDFELESLQLINDYSIFSGYDTLINFTVTDSNMAVINNFDGMADLADVTFTHIDQITDINNSFNNLSSLDITSNYVNTFTLLDNVDSSFDIFGLGGLNNSVTIDGSITVNDSFNNTVSLSVVNGLETAPLFDEFSFDLIEDITLSDPNYSSYAFVSDYASLDEINIESLSNNITDLVKQTITSFTVSDVDSAVTLITLDINESASVDLTSSMLGTLNLNTDNDDISLDFTNGDVLVNNATTEVTFRGVVDDLTLNNNSATQVDLVSLSATNIYLNTNLLSSITSNATTGSNADYLEVNTNVSTANIDVRALSLTVNDNLLSNVTFDSPNANVTLNSLQPDLVIDGSMNAVNIEYDLLETVDIDATVGIVVLDSNLLDTVITNTSPINNIFTTSDVAILSITGSNINSITITDNSINDLSVNTPGAGILLSSSNNETLDILAISDSLNLNTGNVSVITTDNLTNINQLDLQSLNSLSSITFNDGQVDQTTIDTASSTLTISGSGSNDVSIDGINLDTIDFNVPNADFDMNTNQTVLNGTVITNTIDIDNSSNLTDIVFTDTTSITTLGFTSTNNLEDINLGLGTVASINMSTTSASFTFSGVNVSYLSLTGNVVSGLDVDVSSNDFDFISTKTGTTSVLVKADTADLDMNSSFIAFDSNSVIDTIILDSGALSVVSMGNADVGNMNVVNSSTTLNITSTQVDNMTINDNINDLDLSLPLNTVVDFTTSSNGSVDIDVNTSDITVNASADVTINSSTLVSSTVNNPSNITDLNVTKAALDFTLGGNMDTARFSVGNLNNISFAVSTVTDNLVFNNTNVTSFDLTNTTVADINISTNNSAVTIDSTTLSTALLNGTNLNSLTVNNNTSGDYQVFTDVLSFDFDGDVSTLNLTANSATALDLNNMTVSDLTLNVNSLAILDLLDPTITLDDLTITTTLDNFEVDTNSSTLDFTSNSLYKLLVNSTSTGTMVVTTNTDEVEFDAINTNIDLSGNSINAVSGVVNDLLLDKSLGFGTITVSADANDVTISNDNINTLFFTGTNLNSLIVTSDSLSNLATNNIAFSTLQVTVDANDISIDSLADTINVNGFPATSLTFNIRTNGQYISVNSSNVTLNTTNSSSTSISYNNPSQFNLEANNLNNVDVTMLGTNTNLNIDATVTSMVITGNSLTTVTLEGTMNDIDLVGALIDFVITTNLSVNNIFTMNDSSVTTIDFVSPTLFSSLSELSINTLDVANIEDVITLFDGSGKTLDTNLTLVDVYNHYYDIKYTELDDLETLNNNRFDSYYNPLTDAALARFRLSTYFNYVVDNDLLVEINNQTYSTAEEYLLGYAIDEGYIDIEDMEENTSVTDVNNIRVSIQATLDHADLVINSAQIDIDVEADIASEADSYAISERDTIGFTIT